MAVVCFITCLADRWLYEAGSHFLNMSRSPLGSIGRAQGHGDFHSERKTTDFRRQSRDAPALGRFSFAEEAGLIEPLVDMGESVVAGQVVARIHPIGKTGALPADVRSKMDGIVCARHFPGLVKPGDCVAVVAIAV